MAITKRGNIRWEPDPQPPDRTSVEWYGFVKSNAAAFQGMEERAGGGFTQNNCVRFGSLKIVHCGGFQSLWLQGPPQVMVYPHHRVRAIFDMILETPNRWTNVEIKMTPGVSLVGGAPLIAPDFNTCLKQTLIEKKGKKCAFLFEESLYEGKFDELLIWVNADKKANGVIEVQAWQRMARTSDIFYIHARGDKLFERIFHLDGSMMTGTSDEWDSLKVKNKKIKNRTKGKYFVAVDCKPDENEAISREVALNFVRAFIPAEPLVNEAFQT